MLGCWTCCAGEVGTAPAPALQLQALAGCWGSPGTKIAVAPALLHVPVPRAGQKHWDLDATLGLEAISRL